MIPGIFVFRKSTPGIPGYSRLAGGGVPAVSEVRGLADAQGVERGPGRRSGVLAGSRGGEAAEGLAVGALGGGDGVVPGVVGAMRDARFGDAERGRADGRCGEAGEPRPERSWGGLRAS
jgi:hypothetical protein